MWKQSYRLTKLFNTPEFKGPLRVAVTIKTKLQKFRLSMPIIHVVANTGLTARHWSIISQILSVDIFPNSSTTLNDMLRFSNLFEDNLSRLTEITNLADKEYSIEQAFKKMKSDWNKVNFTLTSYTNNSSMSVLTSFEDMQTLLNDHLIKTTTMKNLPFIAPFEHDVYVWLNDLVITDFHFLLINFHQLLLFIKYLNKKKATNKKNSRQHEQSVACVALSGSHI